MGPEGADAAWYVLQHAIGDPWLQRKCLPLLQAAASQGEVRPAHAAYLEDRISFFEGRPQRYGTQFDWDEKGEMSPWQLEDPEKVDDYRRAVGLDPLADRISAARKRKDEESVPSDLRKRRQEMEAWARSVGWRT